MRVKALFLAFMLFFFQTFQVDNLQVNGVINGGLASYSQSGTGGAGRCTVYPSSISTDAFAAFNACRAQFPGSAGVIDALSLGPNSYTVTTRLTALLSGTVVLVLPQGISFTVNTAFSGTLTSSPANCAIPIGGNVGGGSAIIVEGNNNLNSNIYVGSSARIWDLVCSGSFNGDQESLRIDGLSLTGNPAASMSGALLHLQGLFVGTRVSNTQTYQCNGQCVELDAGNGVSSFGSSDLIFDGDNFQDGTASGTYPGSVLKIDALSSSGGIGNIFFFGGAIQYNGPHNPLIVINGRGGPQTSTIEFSGVDFETSAAQTSEANPNVDPIQLTDVQQVTFSNLHVTGATNSTYQQNLVDISQTISNNAYGIHINQLQVASAFGYACLINNTVEGTCEAGFSSGHGELTLPPYYFGGGFNPQTRQSSYLPTYACANGSTHTYSGGTTGGNDNLYICSQGTWVAVK